MSRGFLISDSVIGADTTIEEAEAKKVLISKSVIGKNCKISENCSIGNSVIMNNVIIEKEYKLISIIKFNKLYDLKLCNLHKSCYLL